MELYPLALLWTLATELPVFAVFARAGERGHALAVALAANLITHPIAFALGPELGFGPTEALVVAGEAWIVTATGLASGRRALALVLLANALSTAGVFVFPV